MSKLWRKVDPVTGMFLGDVILTAPPVLEDGTPDPAYIAEPVPPDAGLYHPRWDFAAKAWTEGLTPEEIAARQAATPPEPTPEELRAALEAAMLEMILGGVAGG